MTAAPDVPMLPPGPRGHTLRNTLEYMLRPAPMLERHRARYGEIFRLRTLKLDAVFVCSSRLAKEIFAHDPDDYGCYLAVLGSETLGTHSLSSTAGARHRGQRKLLNPRFHGAQLKRFLERMKAIASRHLAVLEKAGAVLKMSDLAAAISLDIVVETVFGAQGQLDRARARAVLADMLEGFSPLVLFTPSLRTRAFPPWRKFVARRDAFDAFVKETIEARRAEPTDDFVTTLLDVRDEAGAPIDDQEIRDHLLTLILAGHETTELAIAWGVYFLHRDPRVLARLRGELGPAPALEALMQSQYLGAVVSETLRMRPPLVDTYRPLLRPMRVGPWTIPAGASLVVSMLAVMTDPAIYPEPERFRPERFLERKFGPGEFIPFGGGHRRCLGAAFAESQLRIVLGTIITRWDLELADARPEPSTRRHVTMGPGRGVKVRVKGPRSEVQHRREVAVEDGARADLGGP
jgi:cytochrome P450